MINSETLTLADTPLPTIKVHATAVFSILHSFMRRGSYRRVVGTLLGSVKDGVVEIFDCFEVPCDEKEEEMRVTIDVEYQRKMYDFHRRINKRETIVGWFSTTSPKGAFITDTTSLINDFYAKQCKKPIILVVDTSLLNGDSFNIRAYTAKSLFLARDDESFANMFAELKVSVDLSEIESNFLYHMVKYQDSPDPEGSKWTSDEVISYLPTEQERTVQSLESLLTLIDSLSGYVDGVVDGNPQTPAIAEIGMSVSDILSSLQAVSVDDIKTMYKDKVQDLLLVSYMATLAKTQIQLAAKLHAVL